MTIKAIETRYAGCRFRSRLEARWAVFFDALGIEWDYEPEGFEFQPPWCDDSGNPVGETYRYLPDFWLPRLGTYVEVKGSDTMADASYREMLSTAVDFETTPLSRGLLLLGPIPDTRSLSLITHSQLVWQKGVYCQQVAFCSPYRLQSYDGHTWFPFFDTDSVSCPDWPMTATWEPIGLTISAGGKTWPLKHELQKAYAAARSARFEYGESG